MQQIEPLNILQPSVQPLQIENNGKYNPDVEEALQEAAEVPFSTDYQAVRDSLAASQQEQDLLDMMAGSELALSMGTNSLFIADMVRSYIPKDTSNISLEYEAASKSIDKALVEDEITYNNNLSFDEDVLENVDTLAINHKFGEMIQDIRDSSSPVKVIGSYVLHGLTNDITLVDDIKQNVTAVNWGDAVTYQDLNKAFMEQWKTIEDEQGLEGVATFIDTLKSQISSLSHEASRQQMVEIMTLGDDFGDFSNGLPILGAVVQNLPLLKAAGRKTQAVNMIKYSDDTLEKVPSAVKKTVRQDPTINYANDVEINNSLKEIANDEAVKDIVNKYSTDYSKEITDLDKSIIRRTLNNKVQSRDLDVVDVTNVVQDEDGTITSTILLGDGLTKQSAMTKKGVDNLAKELGITDYKAVKKDGAGYYLQTDITGSVKSLDTAEFGAKGFGRMFYGSTNMPKWFHEELIANYRKATKMEKTLADSYGKKLRGLSGAQKDRFTELYMEGQRANNGRGTWWNVDQMLRDGEIDKATADAYTAFRTVSDIDYIVSNEKIWNKLNRFGYVDDVDGDIVKEIKTGITKTPNFSQMIIKNGDELITSKTHSAEQIESLLANGDVLVEVAPISVKTRNLDYTHKIINPSKIKDKLSHAILPYRPGGRRRYAYGTNFLKIGVTKNIGGEMVNAYSKVLGAVSDAAEAVVIRDELNRALRLAKQLENTSDSVRVTEEIVNNPFKKLNISNTDDLKRATEGLSLDQSVQIVKEGESMIYSNGLRTLHEDPLDYDMAFAELSKTRGTFDQVRGNILDNLLGKEARLVNPFDIFDQTVRRASFNNSLGALYDQMGQIFKNKYIDFIDTSKIPNPRTMSGEELLRNGKLKSMKDVPNVHKAALREAINMQNIYQRLSSTPTDFDKYINRMMNGLSSIMAKTGIFSDRTLQRLAKTDPVAYARAFLFQTTLGMFNLKQLWAQSLGALTMFPAHPIVYTRAMLAAPFVFTGYAVRNTPALKQVAKGLSQLTGISPKDFDNLLEYFDTYGTTMGTYRMPMAERVKTFRAMEMTGAVLRSPVELGTNIANVVNDIAAYLQAPVKNFKKIAAVADDWSMNQTRATQSAFQAGQYLPTKTIAQFTTWPHRVMESMLNRRLTKLERMGILFGQLAMWGTASTILSKEDASTVNRYLHKELQIPEAVRNIFVEGIITSYFREMGLEVNEGIEGAGILSGAYDIVEAVLSGEMDEVSFQVPGSLNFVSRAGSVVKAALALGYGVIGDEDFNALRYAYNVATDANMATGFRNASKAFIGLYYHKAFNTKGDTISDSITDKQSIGMLFGASLLDSATSSELYNIYQDSNKYVEALYEDGMKDIVEDIALDLDMSDVDRRNLTNKFNETLNAHRTMIYDTYGSAGVKHYNELLQKQLSKKTVARNNQRYSRQYGEVVLQYLSDYFYNRSGK